MKRRRLELRCERFEFCPEVTAKVCRLGIRIHEVPISYRPRTKAEGKKIGWRDGLTAIWTLFYWRFAPFPQPGVPVRPLDRSAEVADTRRRPAVRPPHARRTTVPGR